MRVQMLMSLMQDLLSKILMYYVSEYSRRLMVSLSYTRMTMNPADMWMADV